MNIKPNLNQTGKTESIPEHAADSKNERTFKLSLPASVSGSDAVGHDIDEKTRLIAISSEKATFLLNSKVIVGSQLNLSLEIPKTLILESSLNLALSGRVTMVQFESDENKPVITLLLNRSFKIRPVLYS
ncbi:hypothetical protein ACFLT9_12835 [Acidobacteriota bacterium]